MIVIASKNGNAGIEAAIDILRAGGTALDAVEAGIKLVEANPADHTVGYNGYPNILGELELDASIMDGRTLESGAVAAMKGFPFAIPIARKVMEKLPHVLLAGDGAARFALEMGYEPQTNLLEDEVLEIRRRRLLRDMPAETFDNLAQQKDLWDWVKLATDPEKRMGTVNFIAQDKNGDICSGVSTSGWAWKYPGRIGDSPLIGAGNFADNRYGACGCTGMGEMAIRAATAHSLILYMKMGMSVEEAAATAMTDLRDLGGRFISGMNLIAVDKEGNPAGFTSQKGRTYIYQTPEMDTYVEQPRQFVEIPPRWDEESVSSE